MKYTTGVWHEWIRSLTHVSFHHWIRSCSAWDTWNVMHLGFWKCFLNRLGDCCCSCKSLLHLRIRRGFNAGWRGKGWRLKTTVWTCGYSIFLSQDLIWAKGRGIGIKPELLSVFVFLNEINELLLFFYFFEPLFNCSVFNINFRL